MLAGQQPGWDWYGDLRSSSRRGYDFVPGSTPGGVWRGSKEQMSQLSEANEALLARKYRPALRLFRAAVDEEPQNALAHQGLAQAFMGTRAYDEAISECKKALGLEPNLSLPHVVMAYANYGRKNLEAFRAEAHEAYRLDPASADVLTCYGIMLLLDRDLDAAKEILREALRLNPADIVARTNLAYAFEQTGDSSKALDENKQIFLSSPSIRRALRLLLAFLAAHPRIFGVALVLCTLSAFFLRSRYLLVPAAAYAGYALVLALWAVIGKQWKSARLTIEVAVFLIVVTALVYAAIR